MTSEHPRIWFFAGGTFANGRVNLFTRTFMDGMKKTYGDGFRVVEGIYHPWSFFNVLWALTWAQRPFRRPSHRPCMKRALQQLAGKPPSSDKAVTSIRPAAILVGSSYGSVVAAQFGCYLASLIAESRCTSQQNTLAGTSINRQSATGHSSSLPSSLILLLGTTVLSVRSDLYLELEKYRQQGIIREIIYERLQDEGDNAAGLAGRSRVTAYMKALGIVFPWVTFRYKPPSFLNQHPVRGHIHQRRAHSREKADHFMREIDSVLKGW